MAAAPDAPPPADFSWKKLFAEQLADKKAGGAAALIDVDAALKGKHVAVYFSAHWCPPCRAFTPQLANTYAKLKKDGKDFEVVFVSMDRNQEQFDDYFSSMPWLAVPFQDDQLRSVLTRKFNVQGIPQLVMLAPDSTVLSANARGAVAIDPSGEKFPWAGATEPKAFPMPWLLLVFLVFWLVNTFLFPPSKKG
ncbi:hypothetical protein HT031_005407 [Scenedesmus sp. PABB004]|nr:hypothetical protein HT031_005407 [Scenedesmus sp. PABB004]